MYKLLLTCRYLLTRYIALVSVVSVTLGVATMIVVNAVMLGFSREMENRMHGVLSDVTISAWASLRGFEDVDQRMKDVMTVAGDMVEAVTPTVSTQALLNFELPGGESITKPVELFGIDMRTQAQATSIAQYLQHPENRRQLSFKLYEDGYDTRNHLSGKNGVERPLLATAGWMHRRQEAKYEKYRREEDERQKGVARNLPTPQSDHDPFVNELVPPPVPEEAKEPEEVNPYAAALNHLPDEPVYPPGEEENAEPNSETDNAAEPDEVTEPGEPGEPAEPLSGEAVLSGEPTLPGDSPLDAYEEFQPKYDPETEQDTGAILGIGLVSGDRRKVVDPETKETFYRESLFVVPGDDVTISLLALGSDRALPSIVYDRFTITDLYESRMVLYDQSFVFVPIEKLQKMRNMIGSDGKKMASHLLIKAKPGVDIDALRDRLIGSPEFPSHLYSVKTWRDSEAGMLDAVAIELSVLNVLLFLIVAVAGFGILAIFFMIVVEKTRDIGILKSLGASGFGVMQIFLFYGLALGLLGSGFGLVLGILIVRNINVIARWLSQIMGHDVFNPEIYNFYELPAIIEPWTVVWIVVGSVSIAVVSGVLPALRAARLNPVDALRV